MHAIAVLNTDDRYSLPLCDVFACVRRKFVFLALLAPSLLLKCDNLLDKTTRRYSGDATLLTMT